MLFADIMDVLGSPVWTVLATLLAAAAILVTIWLFRRQQARKSLSYRIKVTQLVSVHSAAKDRIKVFFENEEIEQVHLVEIRVENDGNVPIERDDFEQAISFDLGTGASALTIEVADLKPPGLQPALNLGGQQIELMPMLLNPGDGLTLLSFVRGLAPSTVVCGHSRIVGVPELTNVSDAERPDRQRLFASVPVLGLIEELSLSAQIAICLAGLALLGIVAMTGGFDRPETNTKLQTKNGTELCGKVLETSPERVVLQVDGSGKVQSFPLSGVEAMRDNSC